MSQIVKVLEDVNSAGDKCDKLLVLVERIYAFKRSSSVVLEENFIDTL